MNQVAHHIMTTLEIDASVSAVNNVGARLQRLRSGPGFDHALHASLSRVIDAELARIRKDDPVAEALPVDLRTEVRHWRTLTDDRELEPIIQLRSGQWQAAVIELLERLDHDWDSLVPCFSLNRDVRLTSISAPLGDHHNNGRSVYKISFEDGRALIYKPRSVANEHLFSRVIRWLGERGSDPALMPCDVLPRDGYGWTGYVETAFCRSAEEAKAFYGRQGAFVALFYLLAGSDCLGENAIVSGEHPVWVDTECLYGPTLKQTAWTIPVPDWMRDSVLSTGMVYAGSNLGLSPRYHTGLSLSCARHRSRVFDDNDALTPRYLTALKAGLCQLYNWIASHRDAWTSNDGPLSWWRDGRARTILRGTHVYTSMVDWLLMAPATQRQAVRSAIERALHELRQQAAWPDAVVSAELEALERGDIPYWTAPTSSRDLQEANGPVVPDVATRTGLECVIGRAARMSPKDLESQLWIIDSFLCLPDRA